LRLAPDFGGFPLQFFVARFHNVAVHLNGLQIGNEFLDQLDVPERIFARFDGFSILPGFDVNRVKSGQGFLKYRGFQNPAGLSAPMLPFGFS